MPLAGPHPTARRTPAWVGGAYRAAAAEISRTPLPIPQELALELSAAVARWGSSFVITDGMGGQTSTWAIERAVRAARPKIAGLPEAFRFHDLRHYLASLLIGSGLDVKVVQHRLRYASAKTTSDTYGSLWPDSDENQPEPPLVRWWRLGLRTD